MEKATEGNQKKWKKEKKEDNEKKKEFKQERNGMEEECGELKRQIERRNK